MLTNTAAVEAIADGDGVLAGLRPGTVWADLSTIAPDASVALAERVAATGAYVPRLPGLRAAPPRSPPARCR